MTGRLIVFEGGDGTGKSTQAARLAESRGSVLTRQPGGTEVGAAIRGIVLGSAPLSLADRTEALLLAADRAQHVAEVIRPALEAGREVICDRYRASSIAYQGYGRGLPPDDIAWLSDWATGGLLSDLTVLLDLPPRLAHDRLGERRDRLESAPPEFHERVRAGYLALAAADAAHWVVVDASGPSAEVAALVVRAVDSHLQPR